VCACVYMGVCLREREEKKEGRERRKGEERGEYRKMQAKGH